MFSELKTSIEDILGPVVGDMDVDIVDIRVHHKRSLVAIELIVDKPQGGITLAECAFINKTLAAAIEQGHLIDGDGDYTLEVNSPGLDRPLKTEKDFNRVTGRKVRFYLSEKVENRLEYVGNILGADSVCVLVELVNKTIQIPLDKINKAVQEI